MEEARLALGILGWLVGLAVILVVGTALLIGLTFLARKFTKLPIKPEWIEILVKALVAEVPALALLLGGALAGTRGRLDDAEDELRLCAGEWEVTSLSWMNEPSGLSECRLEPESGTCPMFVGVDDEEPGVFVLQAPKKATSPLLVRARLPLRVKKGEETDDLKVDDLEGIAYDGTRFYYAVTSHRRSSESQQDERRLLRFRVSPTDWKQPRYEIVFDREEAENIRDLSGVPCEDQPSLGDWLEANIDGFSKAAWLEQQHRSLYPYAVEIEGLA